MVDWTDRPHRHHGARYASGFGRRGRNAAYSRRPGLPQRARARRVIPQPSDRAAGPDAATETCGEHANPDRLGGGDRHRGRLCDADAGFDLELRAHARSYVEPNAGCYDDRLGLRLGLSHAQSEADRDSQPDFDSLD